MDPMPLCAWCGPGARDVPGAKFDRQIVTSKDGSQRVSFGLHYREDGATSCVNEDPLTRELDAKRITGDLLRQVSERGPGRLLIRQVKQPGAGRMRPIPVAPRRGLSPRQPPRR